MNINIERKFQICISVPLIQYIQMFLLLYYFQYTVYFGIASSHKILSYIITSRPGRDGGGGGGGAFASPLFFKLVMIFLE